MFKFKIIYDFYYFSKIFPHLMFFFINSDRFSCIISDNILFNDNKDTKI